MTTIALRLTAPLAELWRYRELMRRLTVRNLKVRYQRSALGFLWTLLNPLFTMAILVAVFGYVIRVPVPNYWAFLVSGYFAWVFVLHTLGTSAFIIPDHAYMARAVAFPSEILVFSSAAARLAEFCAELLLAVVVLVVFHHQGVPASFALLPLLVVLHLMITVGLAMPIAALSVFFHDVKHALPVALTMLAYIAPVFYPASAVPEAVRPYYMLNPLASLLTLYHQVLYEGRMPSAQLTGGLTVFAVVTFLAGYVAFRRHRALFAEIV